MLKVVKNFMEFFVEESWRSCTPCREGNEVLLEGLEMLEYGECSTSYLRELVKLGETMVVALARSGASPSPNAFLSIVENFRDELMGRTVAE